MKAKSTTRPPRTKKLGFADLPRDYAGLCGILTPRPIRDEADLANTVEVTDAMVLHADDFSADQADYFDVLCTLIEAYETQNVKWPPKRTPLQRLQYLVEQHGLSGADLSRILGVSSRHLGPMILRGERDITADHARALAAYFRVSPAAFIA